MPSLNFRIAKVRSLRGRLLTAAAALVVAEGWGGG